MTLQEELSADLADAIEDYEQTFEWNGRSYPCVRYNQPTDLEIIEGGFAPGIGSASKPGIDFTFVVAKSVLIHGLPAIGDPINRGRNQIKNLGGDDDPTAVSLMIYAGSHDR